MKVWAQHVAERVGKREKETEWVRERGQPITKQKRIKGRSQGFAVNLSRVEGILCCFYAMSKQIPLRFAHESVFPFSLSFCQSADLFLSLCLPSFLFLFLAFCFFFLLRIECPFLKQRGGGQDAKYCTSTASGPSLKREISHKYENVSWLKSLESFLRFSHVYLSYQPLTYWHTASLLHHLAVK